MSAQDELPPDELPPGSYSHNGELWWGEMEVGYPCAAWEHFTALTKITREDLATMRAAVRFTGAVEALIASLGAGGVTSMRGLQALLDAAREPA